MKRALNWLSRRRFPYEPLIDVEISRQRLLHNLEEFRKLAPGGQIAPVLKSNAYGHGLLEVAGILKKAPAGAIPFCVVDSYFEAIALRARHCKMPLLIIGYTRPETIHRSHFKNIAFTVTSLKTLKDIAEPRWPVHIHLKIDTGMRRQGLMIEEIPEAIEIIRDDPRLIIDGICTHLSSADSPDESFTEGQARVWSDVVKQFKAAFPGLKYIHASATDGARFDGELIGNVLRLGIGLYGLAENAELQKTLDIQPVMEVKTIITDIKKLRQGETVGYGNIFKATAGDMTIATVPFGYYEGLDRRMSSGPNGEAGGYVLVGPKRVACPIIGRVSMNITIIDVSAAPETKIGDAAVVMSRNAVDMNSIQNIAIECGTITYEIVVKIPPHLKRVVVN